MYDFIVVGSGIAGLYSALRASQHGRVLVLAKSAMDDTNTNHAQGGIAAAVGPADSAEQHWLDTIRAGAGLTDAKAAWVLASEASARIRDLVDFGVPFDSDGDGLSLGLEAAHSSARVLHAGGDRTGASIQAVLGGRAQDVATIDIREGHHVVDLLVADGAVRGVAALNISAQRLEWYEGRAVILATGGAGRLFEHTTNPPVATGSGVALAYRAGASVADLEFCQFHPTALALPGAPRFLISEAARGEGGVLRNAQGRRFTFDYDARGELAPRDVVATAIYREVGQSAAVYLDLTHLPKERVVRRFPGIAAFCREQGLDITVDPIPVAPAAHYMMGGVVTDLWGRTTVPGLFACGEVACTGVHGGNRLASNSLLEALVFGERIVRFLKGRACGERLPSEFAGELRPVSILEGRLAPGEPERWATQSESRPAMSDVQKLMWSLAGMERSHERLELASETLWRWSAAMCDDDSLAALELRDLILVGRLVVAAALARRESRGAHRRTDFPAAEASWQRRLVYRDTTRSKVLAATA